MNDPTSEDAAPLDEMSPDAMSEAADGQEYSMAEGSGMAGLPAMGEPAPQRMDTIMRIPVTVRVVLGSATMPVANLMKLGRGSIIPLERRVGEPVEVAVNGHTVAKGQVVVMDEATSRFGIKLTEIISATKS